MPMFWLKTQRRLLDEINCVGDENRRTLECPTSFSAEIEATPIGRRIASTRGEEGYAPAIVSGLAVSGILSAGTTRFAFAKTALLTRISGICNSILSGVSPSVTSVAYQ